MSDYFALLDEPRRPWLDPDRLKEKFFAASATVHPDRVHGLSESERAAAQERYTRLNAAYSALRDPRERLRHLLELERGASTRDIQQVPSFLMDLSLKVGQACRRADALIAEKSRTVSPLFQVKIFERAQEEIEKLQAAQREIRKFHDQLLEDVGKLDLLWVENPSAENRRSCLDRMEELQSLFGYVSRWTAQLQDRSVQLSM